MVESIPSVPPPLPKPPGKSSWQLPALIGFAAGVAGGALMVQLILGSKPAPAPAPSASAMPEPSSAPPAAPPTLVERAAQGDQRAIAQLKDKAELDRTAGETLALAGAQAAAKRAELAELERQIALLPDFGRSKGTKKRLRSLVADHQVAVDTLRMLASLPGPVGPDLLDSVGTYRRNADAVRSLAAELLLSKDVRSKASKAVNLKLDLERVEDCDAAAKLLELAKKHADQRSLMALGRMHSRRGCGPNKRADCWVCLRKTTLLVDATRAARKRKSP